MTPRQTQRRFGLLQRHFSQQETVRVTAASPSNILSDSSAIQTNTERTPPARDDLALYQAIPTMPDPESNQIISAMPESGLDPAISTISDQVTPTRKLHILRAVAIMIALALALAFYLIWRPVPLASSSSSSPLIKQQNFSETSPKVSSRKSSAPTDATTNSVGHIQVYIVGAVKHPGIYTLPINARVYQLLQAAGGPLPNANLVTLNLAAKLNDGQEIYVTFVGESSPLEATDLPSSSSASNNQDQQLVNINTASADELRQQLSISSKTAQSIITYRQQHGPFTSVIELSQVVSKSIYDKIKNKVTV